jgi:hypothetical protein
MLLYLFGVIVLLIVVAFAYIRVTFKFWADQPVLHIYDIQYWFKNKGIIEPRLPEKNKYCNFKSIETREYASVSDVKLSDFTTLIQNNYLKDKDNVFLPLKENIVPYFTGHNAPSYWSFYWETALMNRASDSTIVKSNKLIGAITSRPLTVIINNGNKDAHFPVYYVDYLCVHKSHRKKGIAPQLIQTHEYNQRHSNKSISVSLFKREEELTGIIPICIYNTYAFPMKNWCKPLDLNMDVKLVKCGKTNFHYLFHLLNSGQEYGEGLSQGLNEGRKVKKAGESLFDISILPEVGNIMELIKTDNIFVYMIVEGETVIGAYFFRKSCTFIEKGKEALSCFASIYDLKTDRKKEFIHGYKMALAAICTMPGTTFHFAVVENISSNNLIVDDLMIKTKPYIVSPTGYFFYNFAYSTFNANRVLIIN